MSTLVKKSLSTAVILVMFIAGLALISLLVDDGPEVDAAKSKNPDAFGYIWVDNQDPDPKIEYDWIDAAGNPKSEPLPEAWNYYYYYGDHYQDYTLPFDFPYYGRYIRDVQVMAFGAIDTNGFQYNGYYYHYYGLPYTGYEDGQICAWAYAIGAYYYYNTAGDFMVYALQGETYGEKWVCFEWNKAYAPGSYCNQPGNANQITFEIILYESGIIKMQYLDADTQYTYYSNGGYAVAGLENHDGRQGIMYTAYADKNLYSGLAVMYGKDLMEISSVSVDTDDAGVMYAQAKDYTITATIVHPVDCDNIKVAAASVGDGLASLVMFYNGEDGTAAFSEVDPNNYVTVNPDESYAEMDPEGRFLRVFFKFTPNFAYPTNFFQGINVMAMGAGALPGSMGVPDAFWVENKLDMMGSMVGYSTTRGFIENGGWVHGNEEFQFRGIRAVYPGTVISPMPGAITFTITDEEGNQFYQDFVEQECKVDVLAENDYTQKQYTLDITGVPRGTDISDDIVYLLNVDPYRPLPPEEIFIHADSYVDKNTAFDDDNEVYVTWQPAEDFESGIDGYYVSTYDPLEPGSEGEATYVKSPDTSTKMIFADMGSRKIWVWSVDRAGNPSIPSFAVTKIDATEITFSEFSPGHQIWVNTHTPVCSALVDDAGGSGVAAKDLQYSVSTTTVTEYNAWQPAKVPRDEDQIRLSVGTVFENGKNNYIRFRGRDVAGNGWTQSMDYNVWVDEESISFVNFRPYESEYQNGQTVVVSLDISDVHGGREGSGVFTDTLEFRYTTSGKGLYGDWTSFAITSQTPTSVHVELELEFSEGVDNFIQFRGYDNVGNYATSKEYNVKVNSAPVVEAYIADPRNGIDYVTTEKILFDASGTEDPDGDSLSFTWYSDIDRLLGNNPSFFKTLSPGVHVVTLIVNDPAHSIVETFEITVLEEEQIDPMSIDTDGDGLYDQWEIDHRLNPFRPDSHLDSDNDMFTNFQEYQNDTDPTRATSHPRYPLAPEAEEKGDDLDEQYQSVTLVIVLLSLVVIIALVLLAFTKRRSFSDEVEEEKELEVEEMDYRKALDNKRSERLNMR